MTDRERRAVVERAVGVIAQAVLADELTIADVVAALASAAVAGPVEISPRESVEAARLALRKRMLDELNRLENEGRGREATSRTARKFATNPLDPLAVESLARKLRRWRPRKNFGHVRLLADKSARG